MFSMLCRFLVCLLLAVLLCGAVVLVGYNCLVQGGLTRSAEALAVVGAYPKETADSVLMVVNKQPHPVQPTPPVSATEQSQPTKTKGGESNGMPDDFADLDWRTHCER